MTRPLREEPCAHSCTSSELVAIVEACEELSADAASARRMSTEDAALLHRDLTWLIEDVVCPPTGPQPGRFTYWLEDLRCESAPLASSSSSSSSSSSGVNQPHCHRLRRSPSQVKHIWRERIGSEAQLPVPLQYLTNTAHWLGMELVVERGACLIPRPETETLAEIAMRAMTHRGGGRWVDIGTGSGCLAVALASHAAADIQRAAADEDVICVFGSDVSGDALRVAKVNVHRERERQMRIYGAERVPIVLYNGSLLDAFTMQMEDGSVMYSDDEKSTQIDEEKKELQRAYHHHRMMIKTMPFAGIVSNLPYIAPSTLPTLQDEVRGHEPWLALDGGGTQGDRLILELLQQAPSALERDGFIGIETGSDAQSQRAADAMHHNGNYHAIDIHADLYGVHRFVTARRC